MQVKFHVDSARFGKLMRQHAAVFDKDRIQTFSSQAALLLREIIQRTPPQDGKAIRKIMDAGGKSWKFKDSQTGSMKARQIGMARVAKDSAKLFYRVANWERTGKPAGDYVFLHSRPDGITAVAPDLYEPSPTVAWMKAVRGRHRGNRGGIKWTTRGEQVSSKLFVVKKYPVSAQVYDEGVAAAQKSVGKAKGGWVDALTKLKAKLPPRWISQFARYGRGRVKITKTGFEMEQVNNSPWANRGDDERVVASSIARRERAMANQIRKALEKNFGRGAGAAFR